MRIGDIVAVDVGPTGSVMNYIGIVTRADSWNGIWVTSTRSADGNVAEQPLGLFASGGTLVERPDLVPLREPRARRRPSLGAALVVFGGAVVGALALRGLARWMA